jgi:tryptophan synthase alpha subunit
MAIDRTMVEVSEATRKRLRMVALANDTTMRDLLEALAAVAEEAILLPGAVTVTERQREQKNRVRAEAQARRDAEKAGKK